MQNRFKFAALAALAATAVSANAAVFDLGVNPNPTGIGVQVAAGAFDDIFSFSLTTTRPGTANFTTLSSEFFHIADASWALYLDLGPAGKDSGDHQVTDYRSFEQGLSGLLPAGNYYLEAIGTATGQFGGFYAVATGTAPVPELGTYAMLLAGLGLMGLIARRRAS